MEYRRFDRSVHRYELDHSKPRRKLTCPQCGKEKCFTPYVDVTTGVIVGEQFGVCDHKNKCGYFKYPTGNELKDMSLFVDSNKVMKRYTRQTDADIANCIPIGKMLRTLNPFETSDLQDYLSGVFGENRTSRAFNLYKVGVTRFGDWGKCCVFWQLDKDWVVRTGKIMDYGPDGKRIKVPIDHVCWMHVLDGQDYLLRQCLFGEFLVNFYPRETPVHIVESEKTAIICNIVYPNGLFMACGGINMLKRETIEGLGRRRIILYPDKGKAFDEWKRKVDRDMRGMGIETSDYLESKECLDEGMDIADYFIIKQIKKNKKDNECIVTI